MSKEITPERIAELRRRIGLEHLTGEPLQVPMADYAELLHAAEENVRLRSELEDVRNINGYSKEQLNELIVEYHAECIEAVAALTGLHQKADGVARNPDNAWQWLDWACAECRPESDMIRPGFRCHRHEAAAVIAKHKEATK